MFDEITFEELYGEDFWAEFLEDVRQHFGDGDDLQKQAQVEVDAPVLG